MTPTPLAAHPAADLFPMLADAEYDELRESVREHGLLEPIVLVEVPGAGERLILDGRNRYRACLDTGVQPRFRFWDGECGSPATFAWAANGARRHLTPGQKAAAAVTLLPVLEAEAKERQRQHGGTAPGRAANTSGKGSGSVDGGEARQKAASVVGVNSRYVSDAKRISSDAPAVFEALRDGVVTVPQAKLLADLPEVARDAGVARIRQAPKGQRTKLIQRLLRETPREEQARPQKKAGPPPQRHSRVLERLTRRHVQNLDDLRLLDREKAVEWLEEAVVSAVEKLAEVRLGDHHDEPSDSSPPVQRAINRMNAKMGEWRTTKHDLPQGAVVYRGPSRLTGEPVMVVLTRLSTPTTNAKTGDMVQAYILPVEQHPGRAVQEGKDQSVCGTCPHRPSLGGACYVNAGVGPSNIWTAVQRGVYADWTTEEAAVVLAGAALRIGAWGDPSAVPLDVWLPLVDAARMHTGYTHFWRDLHDRKWRFLMASVDTPEEFAEAHSAGWRTFRLRRPGDPVLDGEQECPADALGVPCVVCGGCDGVRRGSRRPSFWISPHGFRSSKIGAAGWVEE